MNRALFVLVLLFIFALQVAAVSYPVEVFETYPLGENPTPRGDSVVTFGFPFPEGAVSSINSLKVNGATAYQFTELARWSTGSIKWVLADFTIPSLSANQVNTSYAIADGGSGSAGGSSICSQSGSTITANTGTNGITATLKQTNFNIFDTVTRNSDGTVLVSAGNAGGIVFMNENDTVFSSNTSNATRFEIAQNGPVRCQVIVEGNTGTSNTSYRAIIDFFREQTSVNLSVSFKNAFFNSATHKLTNGARVIVDTTLQDATLSATAIGTNGSPFSFTIPQGQTGVVTSYYTTAQDVDEGPSGLPTNPAGYAVETYASGTFINPLTTPVARTTSAQVPEYQGLKASLNGKIIHVTSRYAPYFYPDGASIDSTNGFVTWDVYTPYLPHSASKPVYALPYRLNTTREIQFDFDATGDLSQDIQAFTNKLVMIPVDRTHYGNAEAFFSLPISSLNLSDIQTFDNATNIPMNSVCSDPRGIGQAMKVYRAITTNAPGGGKGNNTNYQETYETILAGARSDYPLVEQYARWKTDFELYYDDKTFTTYPKTTQMVTDWEKKATNTSTMQFFFPGWAIGILDEAHNWAHQSNMDFYHFTGREEFKKGMESAYLRSWLTNFNFYNYVRPMGQEMMLLAHTLQFMKETNHPQFNNHKDYTETWLNDVLNRVTTPKYGDYYWANSGCDSTPSTPAKDNICHGLYLDKSGWLAPPGQKYNASTSTYPEVQALDIDVYNAYGSDGGVGNGDPPNGCQNGQRWWQMTNRLGQGDFELYYTLARFDPSNPIVETLRLRMMDIARFLAGDAVGDGAYKHNLVDPSDAWGWYLYCPLTEDHDPGSSLGAGGTGNGYLLSYLYTFAAEQAATPAEKAWWEHMAINQLIAIHTLASGGFGFVCDREFDPRAQHSIKSFLDSGLTYTPSNYPAGTPYPDPNATFSLGSVVPSTVNKGFDTPITLDGALFTNTDKVEIGNPALLTITPTFVNSGKLTFTLTAAQTNTLGANTFPVRVKQGSTYSNTKNLTIQLLTPTLTSISPSAINSGSSSQLFSLVGTNFQSGGQVKVGTLPPIPATVSSAASATFTLSTGNISTLGVGVFDVTFINPDTGTSAPVSLSILAPGSPILDSYSPIDVEWNTGPTTITLTGSNFQSGVKAWLLNTTNNAINKSFNTTFANSGQVTFSIPLADTVTLGPGIFGVFVVNPDSKLSNVVPNFVIYVPYITAFSPGSIPIDAPATLSFTGYYFKPGMKVFIGSNSYTPTIPTQTSATLSLSVAQLQSLGTGTKNVYLQNPAGGQSLIWPLTITAPGDAGGNNNNDGGGSSNNDSGSGDGGGGDAGDGGAGGGGGGGDGGSGDSGGDGGTGTCSETIELCDGIDNDCDSEIDEGCDISILESGILDCTDPQVAAENGIDCGQLNTQTSLKELDAFSVFTAILRLLSGVLQLVLGPGI